MHTEALRVGVVMQRRRLDNRWQSHQWRPIEIVADAGLRPGMHCLRDDDADSRWLHTGFEVALHSDEGEGYQLNVDAPQPCWFIMWRMDEGAGEGEGVALPKSVTLSYNEAARLMDGGEQVDTLPLSDDMIERVAAFAAEHYRPEAKRKRRKPSFEGGAAVQQMAREEKGQA